MSTYDLNVGILSLRVTKTWLRMELRSAAPDVLATWLNFVPFYT